MFQSALADFITKCVNRHAGHESMAPGLVRLEWNVVRWLCDVLKMPDTAGGVPNFGSRNHPDSMRMAQGPRPAPPFRAVLAPGTPLSASGVHPAMPSSPWRKWP